MILANTHESIGHGPFFSAAQLITLNAPRFGEAIAMLDIAPFFRDNSNRVPGGDAFFENYLDRLSELPTYKFYRSRKKFEIRYESRICLGVEFVPRFDSLYGPPDFSSSYRVDLLGLFYQELLSVLQGMKRKIKKTDDFDIGEFLLWVKQQKEQLPRTENEIRDLNEKWAVYAEELRQNMDPWDLVDIDWSEYHSNARAILDDLFYWDCVNDVAPHGNDSGADLLEAFKIWRKENRKVSTKQFFEGMLSDWQVSDPTAPEWYRNTTYQEIAIGLAFAEIKLHGSCSEWLRDIALECIKTLRASMVGDDKDECANRAIVWYEMMQQKLSSPEILSK